MKQSNLSKRVEKAKKLVFSHNPYESGRYQTWGSKNSEYGKKYYRVTLSHKIEIIPTPDKKRDILVLLVDCQKDTGNGKICGCPGNERHTVCYHGLGALYQSFKDGDKLISFFETYESAVRMAFGGKIAKVASKNGDGFVWAIIKDWPEKRIKSSAVVPVDLAENINFVEEQSKRDILSVQENINLMRGDEDDEGID